MNSQESDGGFTDRIARIDFVPAVGQPPQSIERLVRRRDLERALAFEPCDRRRTLDFAGPPDEHHRILGEQGLERPGRRLGHEQRHDGRRVPELHRPSRRSCNSARTIEALFFPDGGLVATIPFRCPPRAGRTTPSRTRRASRPSSVEATALTGSRRATGRPRSTISTGVPLLTPSISALRLFLASVILAFFTWLE